jgi:hypothetical protein
MVFAATVFVAVVTFKSQPIDSLNFALSGHMNCSSSTVDHDFHLAATDSYVHDTIGRSEEEHKPAAGGEQ